MADQPAREEIAEGTVRGPEGMEEVTGAADYEGVTDSVVGAEVGTAEGVEAPTPEASTEPEKETGAKSNEHIDRVESQSGDKLSRGDSEGVGNEEISSTEGTAGHEGRDDEKGSPHDSKPNGTEGSEEKEKGKEGVVQSVASEDVKLVSPVSPETRATATVIRRTRYGSDPRGTGGVGKVTYKSVKAAQKEEAARIDEEEEIDTTPAISSLPGYLPWERDLEMISAYQDKKEGLLDSYQQYLKENPELWALLADFLQALLIQKPEDVFQFAHDFFRPFDPQAPPPPSLPTTLPPDTGLLFAPGFPLNSSKC